MVAAVKRKAGNKNNIDLARQDIFVMCGFVNVPSVANRFRFGAEYEIFHLAGCKIDTRNDRRDIGIFDPQSFKDDRGINLIENLFI